MSEVIIEQFILYGYALGESEVRNIIDKYWKAGRKYINLYIKENPNHPESQKRLARLEEGEIIDRRKDEEGWMYASEYSLEDNEEVTQDTIMYENDGYVVKTQIEPLKWDYYGFNEACGEHVFHDMKLNLSIIKVDTLYLIHDRQKISTGSGRTTLMTLNTNCESEELKLFRNYLKLDITLGTPEWIVFSSTNQN